MIILTNDPTQRFWSDIQAMGSHCTIVRDVLGALSNTPSRSISPPTVDMIEGHKREHELSHLYKHQQGEKAMYHGLRPRLPSARLPVGSDFMSAAFCRFLFLTFAVE